jgi:hypothetical protein
LPKNIIVFPRRSGRLLRVASVGSYRLTVVGTGRFPEFEGRRPIIFDSLYEHIVADYSGKGQLAKF